MARRFFGKQIQVTVEGQLRQPTSFRLDETSHVIQEILVAWPDHGFGDDGRRRHRWWERRHRNYYRVRTTANEVYEIYHDRGVSLKSPQFRRWYVTRQM